MHPSLAYHKRFWLFLGRLVERSQRACEHDRGNSLEEVNPFTTFGFLTPNIDETEIKRKATVLQTANQPNCMFGIVKRYLMNSKSSLSHVNKIFRCWHVIRNRNSVQVWKET